MYNEPFDKTINCSASKNNLLDRVKHLIMASCLGQFSRLSSKGVWKILKFWVRIFEKKCNLAGSQHSVSPYSGAICVFPRDHSMQPIVGQKIKKSPDQKTCENKYKSISRKKLFEYFPWKLIFMENIQFETFSQFKNWF